MKRAVKDAEILVASAEGASFPAGNPAYASTDPGRMQVQGYKQRRAAQSLRADQIAWAEGKLAKARQALAEFREEARRAGVPPGWVRD